LSDAHDELRRELEETERVLGDALDFLMDDRHLTDEGIAAREVLLRELEEIERDVEAVRQEHRAE
jgi:hypothetical protein